MPAPLIAKVDRLASPAGDPPAHFWEAVSGLPGLEAAYFLTSPETDQKLGIWLWRGREGMQQGHAVLAEAMGHLGPPPMIEERVLDVLSTDGDVAPADGRTAVIVHLGPFTSAAQREAYVANVPRVQKAIRNVSGLCGSVVLADPAGRDLLAVHFWDAAPDGQAVRAAIEAQPLPAGVDGSLLGEPSYVEAYTVTRSIRPMVAV